VEERTDQECERIGLKLMEKGLYAKAAEAFSEASERKSVTGPYLLAQALFATGEYKGAAAAIREGAARNPDWARTKLDLRGFYGDETELRSHVLALEKHQQAHQDDHDAALVMGYVAYMMGDYKRAVAAFNLLPKDDQVAESYRRFTAVELDRARGLEEF
jgi:tetratricopeptide (TPR) repeat protein